MSTSNYAKNIKNLVHTMAELRTVYITNTDSIENQSNYAYGIIVIFKTRKANFSNKLFEVLKHIGNDVTKVTIYNEFKISANLLALNKNVSLLNEHMLQIIDLKNHLRLSTKINLLEDLFYDLHKAERELILVVDRLYRIGIIINL